MRACIGRTAKDSQCSRLSGQNSIDATVASIRLGGGNGGDPSRAHQVGLRIRRPAHGRCPGHVDRGRAGFTITSEKDETRGRYYRLIG